MISRIIENKIRRKCRIYIDLQNEIVGARTQDLRIKRAFWPFFVVFIIETVLLAFFCKKPYFCRSNNTIIIPHFVSVSIGGSIVFACQTS